MPNDLTFSATRASLSVPSKVGAMAKAAKKERTTDSYELLSQLNEHSIAIAEILHYFHAQDAMPYQEYTYLQLMVEEVRASSSQSIMEALDGREIDALAKASKKRLAIEKRLFST